MKRPVQYSIALAVLALTAYGGAIWSRMHGLWTCQGTQASIADFVEYYMLGSLASGPQHLQLYNPEVQLQFQNQLLAPCHLERVFYAQYFPLLVPVLVLLAFMPIGIAYWVWAILQIALFAASTHWFLKQTSDCPPAVSRLITLGALVALPTVDNFHLGQASGFIAAAAILYCWGLLHKRWGGGIGLAVLTWKIQLFFPLATMSLSLRRWKIIAVAAATAAILLIVAGSLIGWSNVFNYPNIVLQADQFKETGVYPERMVCIRGLLSLFMDHRLALRISMGILAVATVIAWAAWLRVPLKDDLDLRWRIAAMFVLTLVISPHVHLHDCMLLAVPALITVPQLLVTNQLSKAEKYWMWSFILYPILSWLYFVPPIIDVPPIYSVATLVFLCTLVFAGWRCCVQQVSEQRK
jgi:hypothetical protein